MGDVCKLLRKVVVIYSICPSGRFAGAAKGDCCTLYKSGNYLNCWKRYRYADECSHNNIRRIMQA